MPKYTFEIPAYVAFTAVADDSRTARKLAEEWREEAWFIGEPLIEAENYNVWIDDRKRIILRECALTARDYRG